MASTLYSYISGGQTSPSPGGNDMMSQFEQFSKTVNNPKAEVEKLLANGQMSQQQFKMLGQMANKMMRR